MQSIVGLVQGFTVLLSPTNVLFCVTGALIGIMAGLLPGISPVAVVALALPIALHVPPVRALTMLAAMAFGALYGRALLALYSDGLEPNGRPARSVASVMVGLLAGGAGVAVLVAAFVPILRVGVLSRSGPAEYVAMVVFIFTAAAAFMPGSLLRALLIIVTGLLLSSVGSDIETGQGRLSFDVAELANGIGFVNIVFGTCVVADMIRALDPTETDRSSALADSGDASRGIMRGIMRGLVGGLLAAGARDLTGATHERGRDEQDLLNPPRQQSVAAIAGAAAASNARLSASFLPFLALGIPTNAVTALLVGAKTIRGASQPDLYWALVATIIVVHIPLLVLMLTIGRQLLWLSRVNYGYVAPVTLAIACVGTYSQHNSAFDVWLMILFGLFGYVVLRSNLERSLLLMAFVLGPLLEENIRRAILIARGDPVAIVQRPITVAFIVSALALAFAIRVEMRRRRRADTGVAANRGFARQQRA